MEEKHEEGDREVPLTKLFDFSSRTVAADGYNDKRRKHSLSESQAKTHLRVVTNPGLSNFPLLGIETPGIFFESYIPSPATIPGIDEVIATDEIDYEQFHDSEFEDIFDLYNACDGSVHDGFLDIRKLDDLSEEELQVLDLDRLREIWLHTISGCPTCARIITTLNSVRIPSNNDPFDPIQSVEGETH